MNLELNLDAILPIPIARAIKKIEFGGTEQQAFMEDLATLVGDGVPANTAVEMLGQIAKKSTVKEVARSIIQKIAEGKSIAEGMVGWFPAPIVELIRAGETGGTLPETLIYAAKEMQRTHSVIASFISSLIYPITVIIMACVVAVFVNKTVFAQFLMIKPLVLWPSIAQTLVGVATFIQEWWWLIILLIFGVLFGVFRMLRDYTGEYRPYIDRLPLLSLYRKLTGARFMETLGMLVGNGITFKQALKILEFNASPYLNQHIIQMEYRLGAGKLSIADVLDTGLIGHGDILRLQAISKVKGVEQALVRLGAQVGEKGEKTLMLTGRVLGGILLSIGAGFAVFMILGIYSVGSSLAA